jgi:2-oxoglutarate ferredoxin oxidoreductase subunit gamma
MEAGKNVTWFPSYGPEMRGGTANCTVIVSDEEIGSPMVLNPQAVIAMNLPSLDKYESMVKEGGVLIVNASLTNREATRKGIDIATIKANEIAESVGNMRMINMVMMGALLERLPVVSIDAIKKTLTEHLPARKQDLLALNKKALDLGAGAARK